MSAVVQQQFFEFGSGEGGYLQWQRDQESRLEAIRREWGVPIGKNVRLRLRNIEGEFRGALRLASMPVGLDRRIPLSLRLDRMTFDVSEIETLAVM